MPDNSLIPVVTNAVIAVSGNITNFITKAKANGFIQRTQLDMLKDQTEKILAEARANHIFDIVSTVIEQLAKVQEHIDRLEKQGRLHDSTLTMALDYLEELNNMLRHNLREFENRVLR